MISSSHGHFIRLAIDRMCPNELTSNDTQIVFNSTWHLNNGIQRRCKGCSSGMGTWHQGRKHKARNWWTIFAAPLRVRSPKLFASRTVHVPGNNVKCVTLYDMWEDSLIFWELMNWQHKFEKIHVKMTWVVLHCTINQISKSLLTKHLLHEIPVRNSKSSAVSQLSHCIKNLFDLLRFKTSGAHCNREWGSMFKWNTIVKLEAVHYFQNTQEADILFEISIVPIFGRRGPFFQHGDDICTNKRSVDVKTKHLVFWITILHRVPSVNVRILFSFLTVHVVISQV